MPDEIRPQDFWLDHLGASTRFNNWVFDSFAKALRGRVLEIGCGTGNFSTLIAGAGHAVTAIDIQEPYVETARQRLAPFPGCAAICADATRLDLAERFDTVVLLDVLEHIENDREFLVRLGAGLATGGNLVLKVPAGHWLYSQMDRAIGHHRRYDRSGLRQVLESAGYEPVSVTAINLFGIFGWWLNGKLLGRTIPPGEQLGLFERLVPAFRTVEQTLHTPWGLSFVAIARKR
jgi:SAM-dependent methyltransferase